MIFWQAAGTAHRREFALKRVKTGLFRTGDRFSNDTRSRPHTMN